MIFIVIFTSAVILGEMIKSDPKKFNELENSKYYTKKEHRDRY